MNRLWQLCFSLVLVLVQVVRSSESAVVASTVVESCSCRKSCLGQFDSTKDHFASIPSSSNSFYFDISLGSCVQLPSLCETNINCAFTSKAHCEASCGSEAKLGKFGASDIAKGGAKLSGCEATKFGCCPDGSARTESRSCQHSDKEEGSLDHLPSSLSRGGGRGIRWDLVVSGVCVMVLLVAVLSVAGVVTYNLRQKKRERMRRGSAEPLNAPSGVLTMSGDVEHLLDDQADGFVSLRYIHNVLEMYDSDSDSDSSDGDQPWKETTKHHKLEL